MNKYIIPIALTDSKHCFLKVVNANSYLACTDKLMQAFSEYSDSDNWGDFVSDLEENGILIGDIRDIEEL